MMLGVEYRQLHPRVVLDFHQHTAIINKLKLRGFVLQLKKRKPAVAEQEHYETITGPSVQRLQLLHDCRQSISKNQHFSTR